MIYNFIGNTSILEIKNSDMADIYLKLEFGNPGGSIKDRPAYYMIKDAEEKGELKENGTIIEATSGNMGIGLSMIARAKGYNVIIVMPETMSVERQKLMKAYGAKVILTEGSLGMDGSVELAKKLAKEKGYYMIDQFENPANSLAHYETTSLEILEALDKDLDCFVAGIGTGGTISGVGKRFKEIDKSIKIVGVEPESSALISKGEAGPHKIQGIGANFIPKILDKNVIDSMMTVSNENAIEYTKKLARDYGILAGISSGANFYAANELAKKLGENKRVVTVLPDSGERYLSTDLYSEE